jgi:flavin reductase (DIM6/NTAB) family NADH-FMN oxidoreductase RutF
MSSEIESVLRLLDREIWIVTAAADSRRGGLCATWVSVASIDPQRPVVVAGLAPIHFTAELVSVSGCFGLHLLRTDQAPLALNFALGSGRERDKFAGLATSVGSTGVPLLDDCLASLECRVFSCHDTGDRLYFWADVVGGQKHGAGPALREQSLIAAASAEQKALLLHNRQEDAAILRPEHDRWRAANLFPPQSHPR